MVSLVFSDASFLIPAERLRETKHWLAIRHPHPAYPLHLLLLPKHAYADWCAIPLSEAGIFSEFLEISQGLVREFALQENGYRLILNGGKNQEFPHLHFHLVSGDPY